MTEQHGDIPWAGGHSQKQSMGGIAMGPLGWERW